MRMQMARGCVAGAVLISLTTSCKTPNMQSQVLADGDAASDQGSENGPPGGLSAEANAEVWNKYCVGSLTDPSVIPGPNYDNETVKQAAVNLSLINPHSFALYSTINRKYRATPVAKPEAYTPSAHEFLTYLCGEFRDRAGMVEAKLNWVLNFNYLQKGQQPPIDPKKPLWMQVYASSYQPYLQLSRQYFSDRQQRARAKEPHVFGQFTKVDHEVPATTICENKFIFAEYIAPGKTYDGIEPFQAGYERWQKENCSEDDLNYYNDFRGDGNFKPNSPESNGMIWQAQSITLQCGTTTALTTKPPFHHEEQKLVLSDQDCANYFMRPFATRWAGARAGLGAWILHDDSEFPTMDNSNAQVDMRPDFKKSVFAAPYDYVVAGSPGKLRGDWSERWSRGDLGLNQEFNQELVYRQLKNAVDRHTNWYASGYDDGMNQGKTISEAYSPLVASSYEMAASDAFTAPCYTIPCNGDVPARNWKQFMFVFKIKKDRWYTTSSIAENKPVDFDRHWFDETSLGTTGLAKGEHAFDRLGTALEDELDTILYLHNICSSGVIEGVGNGGKACDGSSLTPDPADEPEATAIPSAEKPPSPNSTTGQPSPAEADTEHPPSPSTMEKPPSP